MKYVSEFRSPEVVASLLKEIRQTAKGNWNIMEVCGGQTHSLVKNGILNMLPPNIQMLHGPGCPVCVTPVNLIDKAVHLATDHGVILCSFGDMIRVPGSGMSLLEAKSKGADIRILYSPLDAVKIAKENPEREVVFFAVGFETTAPANALSVIHAAREGVKNFSILTSHVLVPPAMEAIMSDAECKVDAFLGAGHVCAIMGMDEYYPIVERYKIPIVVTGFEPVDLLSGILMAVKQLESGQYQLENQYSRVVETQGNKNAMMAINEIFEVTNREWRGIGAIPFSGYGVKDKYSAYDAIKKFRITIPESHEDPSCLSGEVMKGKIKPNQCPNFGTKCIPVKPLGAPMVSSEGACAAYYHFHAAADRIAG
ncbi:hydrogenase formation protein HypD [Mucilaginibacter paludis]|uniref:Hydrogenase expression/formation protein HypD n=1 Tax=Mucilaginibacter paludis DSM 18603 TaxID=714943 RepID=H1Y5G4_9SPHI|nr:hydrogenase formation protein HypD [Mucilaginibacter paludis]EHQ29316.1 hydrogenase expression/formation protein HypD [Mucilaginibacter paludis DSM 18603]